MKILFVAAMILVAGAITAPACAGEFAGAAAEPAFGIGWQDGVTLHWRFLGNWYVEGAAGPNDFLLDSYVTEGGQPQEVEDDKRECGWARLVLGRSLWRSDRLDMQVVCGLRYLWENTQDNSIIWDEENEATWTRKRKLSDDVWDAFLAIRPRWRVHERASLGFDLGLAVSWNHLYETTVEDRPWVSSGRSVTTRRNAGSELRTWGGWDGLGAVHFMFWF